MRLVFFKSRPPIKSPGSKGGKFYRTKSGKIRYGSVGSWGKIKIPPTKEPSSEMVAAYEHGKKHADRHDLMELAYSNDAPPGHWWDDNVLSVFWHAGYHGHEMPKWVYAERYGDIPESGRSRNHASGDAEAGVSVARLVGDRDEYIWRMGGFGGDQRPRHLIGGWLSYKRGSDGEPLLIGVQRVSGSEKRRRGGG